MADNDRESDEGQWDESEDDSEPGLNLVEILDEQDLEQGQSDPDGSTSSRAPGQSHAFIAGMPPEETEGVQYAILFGLGLSPQCYMLTAALQP